MGGLGLQTRTACFAMLAPRGLPPTALLHSVNVAPNGQSLNAPAHPLLSTAATKSSPAAGAPRMSGERSGASHSVPGVCCSTPALMWCAASLPAQTQACRPRTQHNTLNTLAQPPTPTTGRRAPLSTPGSTAGGARLPCSSTKR